jgi:hypothetical protein
MKALETIERFAATQSAEDCAKLISARNTLFRFVRNTDLAIDVGVGLLMVAIIVWFVQRWH